MLKIQNNNKNHAYKFFVDTYYKQPNNEILREMILYSNLDKTEVLKKILFLKDQLNIIMNLIMIFVLVLLQKLLLKLKLKKILKQ